MAKIENIGDVFELLHIKNPKRIVFDLSEDGTFYNTEIFFDAVDRSENKEYEACIKCKLGLNPIHSYSLVYCHEDKNAEIFSITIPDSTTE